MGGVLYHGVYGAGGYGHGAGVCILTCTYTTTYSILYTKYIYTGKYIYELYIRLHTQQTTP